MKDKPGGRSRDRLNNRRYRDRESETNRQAQARDRVTETDGGTESGRFTGSWKDRVRDGEIDRNRDAERPGDGR